MIDVLLMLPVETDDGPLSLYRDVRLPLLAMDLHIDGVQTPPPGHEEATLYVTHMAADAATGRAKALLNEQDFTAAEVPGGRTVRWSLEQILTWFSGWRTEESHQ